MKRIQLERRRRESVNSAVQETAQSQLRAPISRSLLYAIKTDYVAKVLTIETGIECKYTGAIDNYTAEIKLTVNTSVSTCIQNLEANLLIYVWIKA